MAAGIDVVLLLHFGHCESAVFANLIGQNEASIVSVDEIFNPYFNLPIVATMS